MALKPAYNGTPRDVNIFFCFRQVSVFNAVYSMLVCSCVSCDLTSLTNFENLLANYSGVWNMLQWKYQVQISKSSYSIIISCALIIVNIFSLTLIQRYDTWFVHCMCFRLHCSWKQNLASQFGSHSIHQIFAWKILKFRSVSTSLCWRKFKSEVTIVI